MTQLEELRKNVHSKLAFAERLVAGSVRHCFIQHDNRWPNTFAGYLLVTVFQRPDNSWVVYVQDSDDSSMEKSFDSEEKAIDDFERFFGVCHVFDEQMRTRLGHYGYYY